MLELWDLDLIHFEFNFEFPGKVLESKIAVNSNLPSPKSDEARLPLKEST